MRTSAFMGRHVRTARVCAARGLQRHRCLPWPAASAENVHVRTCEARAGTACNRVDLQLVVDHAAPERVNVLQHAYRY